MNRANPIVDFAAKGYESRGKRIFAPKVGEAPSLVAGSSRNLLSPSALEELFLYQRTANGAGGTGAAVFQSIKGNSIVWNQLVDLSIGSHTHSTVAANGLITINASVAASSNQFETFGSFPLIGGHKYLMRFQKVSGDASGALAYFGPSAQSVADGGGDAIYTQGSSSSANAFVIMLRNTTAESKTYNFTCYIQLFDITASTLSVTSVSDFTKFYNLPYYAPNPGAIKNNCATGMVTDGLNQWDEQIKPNGYWNPNTGAWASEAGSTGTLNPIKVSPSTEYYFKVATRDFVVFYDANMNRVGSAQIPVTYLVTTPANAAYMNVNNVRQGDCVNISGARNGQYEPHWSDTTALPITTATGKLNGAGESVVITPNGLAGVGTSFDEAIVEKGMWTKTKKRFAKVDLGSLTWQVGSGSSAEYNFFYASFSGSQSSNIVICDRYAPGAVGALAGVDKSIAYLSGNAQIRVRDLSYNTTAAFTAAVSGIYAYVAITPVEYILDTPVPVVARVDENGTQTILPQGVDESGVPMTAPFAASIQYPMVLGKEFIGADSLKNLLDAAVEGGAITAYTMAYDETTGAYAFTINQEAAAALAAPSPAPASTE